MPEPLPRHPPPRVLLPEGTITKKRSRDFCVKLADVKEEVVRSAKFLKRQPIVPPAGTAAPAQATPTEPSPVNRISMTELYGEGLTRGIVE